MRQKAFSVKIDDCEVQTFRAGGKGGQNQNKRDTGVRIIHRPSGAVAESREGRTQLENKRKALSKLAHSMEFMIWARTMVLATESAEEFVNRQMDEKNIKVEVREEGKWVESNTLNS